MGTHLPAPFLPQLGPASTLSLRLQQCPSLDPDLSLSASASPTGLASPGSVAPAFSSLPALGHCAGLDRCLSPAALQHIPTKGNVIVL